MKERPSPRILRYAGASNTFLPHNGAHAFAAAYALCHYGSDAVYSFIPKNACSTLRYSLAIANGAIEGPAQFNWIHHNNNTFRASLRDLACAQYTFVILRDPYLRLASCFFDKIVEQTPVAYKLFELAGRPHPPHDFTFREFVQLLRANLRDDEHWRPQTDYLVYKIYDDVFALEDFPRAVKTLKKKIGLIVHDARDLTRHGVDQYRETTSDAGLADVAAFDLLALKRSGKAPRLRDFYDAGLVEAVRDLYADDIQTYQKLVDRDLTF